MREALVDEKAGFILAPGGGKKVGRRELFAVRIVRQVLKFVYLGILGERWSGVILSHHTARIIAMYQVAKSHMRNLCRLLHHL